MTIISANISDELALQVQSYCDESRITPSTLIKSLLQEKINGQASLTTIYEDIHSRFNEIDTKFFATYAALEGLAARTLQIYIATLEQSENSLRLFFSGKPMPGNVVTHLGTLQSLKTEAMEEYQQKTARINEMNAQLEQISSQQKNASKEGQKK
jgi:hypothetical protein